MWFIKWQNSKLLIHSNNLFCLILNIFKDLSIDILLIHKTNYIFKFSWVEFWYPQLVVNFEYISWSEIYLCDILWNFDYIRSDI